MKLRAERISRKFNRKTNGAGYFFAVSDADLELCEGKLTVVFGRSGSGKTTLLNMLSGLLAPGGGRVIAGDTDLYSLDDKALSLFRNRHIGVIPQGSTPINSLNVLENVLLPSLMYGRKDDGTERYAISLLETVGIARLKDAMPSELSGGELRRMAIARALINKPEIIFADEPTGDLDDENTSKVLALLRDTAEKGVSVFMVTHEREAADYADIVLKMDAGKLMKV